MAQVSLKPDGDVTRQEIQDYLQGVAEEINSRLSPLDVAASQELLAGFVSALFLSTAKKAQGETRRQRQAEGIAAAKARGVRFGPERLPMPECFEELAEDWWFGRISAAQAGKELGISRSTFTRRAEEWGEAAGLTARDVRSW